MGQDIREMFRNQEHTNKERLNKGHQKRFEARLNEAFPAEKKKNNHFYILQIAAILVIALAVGGFFFFRNDASVINQDANQVAETPVTPEEETTVEQQEYMLSDVSPEFKKIEDYYMASLNLQLAKLELTPENKELVDAFMTKLETLDEEYKALNSEIKETGVTEESVEAMIANLQLRLDLLTKLKNKLNEIKQSNNERYENYQA